VPSLVPGVTSRADRFATRTVRRAASGGAPCRCRLLPFRTQAVQGSPVFSRFAFVLVLFFWLRDFAGSAEVAFLKRWGLPALRAGIYTFAQSVRRTCKPNEEPGGAICTSVQLDKPRRRFYGTEHRRAWLRQGCSCQVIVPGTNFIWSWRSVSVFFATGAVRRAPSSLETSAADSSRYPVPSLTRPSRELTPGSPRFLYRYITSLLRIGRAVCAAAALYLACVWLLRGAGGRAGQCLRGLDCLLTKIGRSLGGQQRRIQWCHCAGYCYLADQGFSSGC